MEDTQQTTINENNQGGDSQASNNEIDLSGLMASDNPDTFDRQKVAELYRKVDKLESDRKFFQTKYQQKQGVPEKLEDYGKKFKADSSYEKFMAEDGVKDIQRKLYEHAKNNGIGVEAANSMLDFMLRTAVESGDLDARTEEQIQAEEKLIQAQNIENFNKSISPLLESTHRTKEENDAMINSFINSNNMFTKDPEIKQLLEIGSKENPIIYKMLTNIIDGINFGNIPTRVTSTVDKGDIAAFEAKYNAEKNPEVREAMWNKFYGSKK